MLSNETMVSSAEAVANICELLKIQGGIVMSIQFFVNGLLATGVVYVHSESLSG